MCVFVKELEDKDRRLREQGCDRPLSGNAGGRDRRSVGDSFPVLSPSCPGLSPAHTPSERSPGQTLGIISLW